MAAVCSGILLSREKERSPDTTPWTHLEHIVESERSQSQKDKYCTIPLLRNCCSAKLGVVDTCSCLRLMDTPATPTAGWLPSWLPAGSTRLSPQEHFAAQEAPTALLRRPGNDSRPWRAKRKQRFWPTPRPREAQGHRSLADPLGVSSEGQRSLHGWIAPQ